MHFLTLLGHATPFAPLFAKLLVTQSSKTSFAGLEKLRTIHRKMSNMDFEMESPHITTTGVALQVKLLNKNATMPSRGSPFSAGFDLAASEPTIIPSHGRGIVKTGISVACPQGTYARIAPRSGLAVKHFIDCGAGVVDADYRGEVGVVLFNFGNEEFKVNVGDRIAQLILEQISMVEAIQVDELSTTLRGYGGFGSTGIRLDEAGHNNYRAVSPSQSSD